MSIFKQICQSWSCWCSNVEVGYGMQIHGTSVSVAPHCIIILRNTCMYLNAVQSPCLIYVWCIHRYLLNVLVQVQIVSQRWTFYIGSSTAISYSMFSFVTCMHNETSLALYRYSVIFKDSLPKGIDNTSTVYMKCLYKPVVVLS